MFDLVSENRIVAGSGCMCVMQDAEVKVEIDLVPKNRLFVGSGCVRVLTMQCVMVFLLL